MGLGFKVFGVPMIRIRAWRVQVHLTRCMEISPGLGFRIEGLRFRATFAGILLGKHMIAPKARFNSVSPGWLDLVMLDLHVPEHYLAQTSYICLRYLELFSILA